MGFPVFYGEFQGFQRASGQVLANSENHCAIRIPDIPFSALRAIAARGVLQLILGIDWPVLSFSAFGTPTTMRDAVVYGPIQTSTISAGLTTRHYFLEQALHADGD